MHIEFVNHSSYILESGDVVLMCDFWYEGMAFDHGWELLCDTALDYADFSRVTHLWFSHEHPDHFSPQNLKQIPPEARAKIEVLFQETRDKRVISFCQKLGFRRVTELPPSQLVKLADGVEICCVPFGSIWGEVDSWLLIKTPEANVLNINDCEIHDEGGARAVLDLCRRFVGEIDLLTTQFSYASKQGNAGDDTWPERSRAYHFNKLELQVRCLAPKYTLPFASFVYFAHRENSYLNAAMIRVDEAVELIARHSTPIVMYPADRWELGGAWDNAPALARYAERYQRVASLSEAQLTTSETVAPDKLKRAAKAFSAKMTKTASKRQLGELLALKHAALRPNQRSNAFLRRAGAVVHGLRADYEPGRIYVKDHEQAYRLTLDGLEPEEWTLEQCQIALHSSALYFCFQMAFGGETLQVNGRFDDIDHGWELLGEYFFLARRLEQGLELPRSVVLASVLHKLKLSARDPGMLMEYPPG